MFKKHCILIFFLFIYSGCNISNTETPMDSSDTPDSVFEDAFKNKKSNIQVLKTAKIIRLLTDDNNGSRHQRFIVKLHNQQTLLIAHNIDIAPRIPDLERETDIRFYGEYEWNAEGGVIHWTHKDPDGSHTNGWVEYNRKRYE